MSSLVAERQRVDRRRFPPRLSRRTRAKSGLFYACPGAGKSMIRVVDRALGTTVELRAEPSTTSPARQRRRCRRQVDSDGLIFHHQNVTPGGNTYFAPKW